MPVDNKRITGPEITIPYELFLKSCIIKNVNKLELSHDIRKDGRKYDEHRKIFLKTGVVTQAKGSAYIEVNNTKVIVSVFDPREIPNRNEYSLKGELFCQFKYATFSCPKRRAHQQDAEEKQNSNILKQALEPAVCRHEFPNLQVDVYALVLENDGSAVSAAITCAGLALAHAGIPMYDLITSVTLAMCDNKMFLDPTLVEEDSSEFAVQNDDESYSEHGVVILSLLDTYEQISDVHQVGSMSIERLTESINILTKTAKEIVPLVQKCLAKHVLKQIKRDVED